MNTPESSAEDNSADNHVPTPPPSSREHHSLLDRVKRADKKRKTLNREMFATPCRAIPTDDHLLNQILANYPWPEKAIVAASRVTIAEPVEMHHQPFLRIFDRNDIIWVANTVYHTGKPGHASMFRRAASWMHWSTSQGGYVCANPFKAGVCLRSDDNVLARKFLVVGSKFLTSDEIGAVFKWMVAHGHVLRAVVRTVAAGLNGWFESPRPERESACLAQMKSLKCDPSLLALSHPHHLAGGLCGDKRHELIYLNLP